jgi:hypothetical protein
LIITSTSVDYPAASATAGAAFSYNSLLLISPYGSNELLRRMIVIVVKKQAQSATEHSLREYSFEHSEISTF